MLYEATNSNVIDEGKYILRKFEDHFSFSSHNSFLFFICEGFQKYE